MIFHLEWAVVVSCQLFWGIQPEPKTLVPAPPQPQELLKGCCWMCLFNSNTLLHIFLASHGETEELAFTKWGTSHPPHCQAATHKASFGHLKLAETTGSQKASTATQNLRVSVKTLSQKTRMLLVKSSGSINFGHPYLSRGIWGNEIPLCSLCVTPTVWLLCCCTAVIEGLAECAMLCSAYSTYSPHIHSSSPSMFSLFLLQLQLSTPGTYSINLRASAL